jgi:FrmR/RcnR family transcriptional regulator, repressor of frmRAB operon
VPKARDCALYEYRVPPYVMTHTNKHKDKLLARVRRLRGQIEAVERSLESDASCGEVLNLVASIRGAVTGLTGELIEDHIREHVSNPQTDPDQARAQGATELIDAIRTYLK